MSYRTDLTERLVTLVFLLARRPHSRQELAREFAVDAKTISKDIAALTRQYPIVEERRGREAFYGFPDNYHYQIPAFTPEEIAALLLAQNSIKHIGITAAGSPFARFADSLLIKIKAALPLTVRERMNQLAAVYGSAAQPAKNFARHTVTIDRLAAAAVKQQRVRFDYHSLNKDEDEKRLVEPYAVYFDPDGATLKFVGNDLKYNTERVFAVERVRRLEVTDARFVRPTNWELQQFLTNECFNGIHGAPVTVRLRASGVTARIFAERRFHPSQRIIEQHNRRGGNGQNSTIIEMRVAAGRGLVRFILSYLPEIEVLAPPELAAEIEQILRDSLPHAAKDAPDEQ